MASKLAGLAAGGIGSLINSATSSNNQVQAQIDPTLLKFLQDQGTLAARFQGSQEGLPYGGSTATTGRAGFNQYAALLNANQTANQVASAQQNIQSALNAGNQLTTAGAGQQGSAAGLSQGSGADTSSTDASTA